MLVFFFFSNKGRPEDQGKCGYFVKNKGNGAYPFDPVSGEKPAMMYSIGGETRQSADYYSIWGMVEEEEQIVSVSELLQETEEAKVAEWQATVLEGK